MRYVKIELAAQLVASHPALLDALRELENWSRSNNIPEPTITELWRTPRQQGDIYMQIWGDILRRMKKGGPVTDEELEQVKEYGLENLNDDELRDRAEHKTTWHFYRCAADLRTFEYSKKQVSAVRNWLRTRCPKPIWERITEKHGTGDHIHIAIRAFEWRRKYNPFTAA